jgi:hypothetical protein
LILDKAIELKRLKAENVHLKDSFEATASLAKASFKSGVAAEAIRLQSQAKTESEKTVQLLTAGMNEQLKTKMAQMVVDMEDYQAALVDKYELKLKTELQNQANELAFKEKEYSGSHCDPMKEIVMEEPLVVQARIFVEPNEDQQMSSEEERSRSGGNGRRGTSESEEGRRSERELGHGARDQGDGRQSKSKRTDRPLARKDGSRGRDNERNADERGRNRQKKVRVIVRKRPAGPPSSSDSSSSSDNRSPPPSPKRRRRRESRSNSRSKRRYKEESRERGNGRTSVYLEKAAKWEKEDRLDSLEPTKASAHVEKVKKFLRSYDQPREKRQELIYSSLKNGVKVQVESWLLGKSNRENDILQAILTLSRGTLATGFNEGFQGHIDGLVHDGTTNELITDVSLLRSTLYGMEEEESTRAEIDSALVHQLARVAKGKAKKAIEVRYEDWRTSRIAYPMRAADKYDQIHLILSGVAKSEGKGKRTRESSVDSIESINSSEQSDDSEKKKKKRKKKTKESRGDKGRSKDEGRQDKEREDRRDELRDKEDKDKRDAARRKRDIQKTQRCPFVDTARGCDFDRKKKGSCRFGIHAKEEDSRTPRIHCTFCKADNHTEERCWKKYPEQRPRDFGKK